MATSLHQKVAIITGSSQGIGKALARDLCMQGARVILNGRRQSRLDEALAELQGEGLEAAGIAGDISDPGFCGELITFAVDTYGQLDILVNNAGLANRGRISDVQPDSVQSLVAVNLLGSIFPTQAALPALRKSGGYVLMISSLAAFHGLPYNGVYSSTKVALKTLAESLRLEEKEHGVMTGLAYVGFTENDPRKIIYDTDGKPVYLPAREGLKLQKPETVARILRQMIQTRRKRRVLTPMGKGLAFLSRWIPSAITLILRSNLQTVKEQSSGAAETAAEDMKEIS